MTRFFQSVMNTHIKICKPEPYTDWKKVRVCCFLKRRETATGSATAKLFLYRHGYLGDVIAVFFHRKLPQISKSS